MIILLRTKQLYDSYKNEKKKKCNVKPLNSFKRSRNKGQEKK